jgi:hypothetical protein
MSTFKNNNPKCCICSKLIKKVSGTPKHIESNEDAEEFSTVFERAIVVGDVVCPYCRVIKYKKIKLDDKEQEISLEDESPPDTYEILEKTDSSLSLMTLSQSSSDDPSFNLNVVCNDTEECIEVQIKRTVITHRYCCVCFVPNRNLVVVPQNARMQSIIKRRIFIPDGNRCCEDHLINKRFYEEDLNLLKVYCNWSILRSSELSKIMESFATECNSILLDKMDDFCIPDEQLYIFTGLRRENLIELRDLLTTMRNTDSRTVTQALIVFLFKLRTGNSNKLISATLQLKDEQLVSKYCEQVMQSFEKDVLPRYFGFRSMSRNDLIENNSSPLVKRLYDDLNNKLVLICDGTYARHQKSSNNEYQRKSFSGQKKVSLCKPFTICTTNGYIVDMLGPYHANLNDATIMKEIIDTSDGICKLLEPGDAFVVDRGFRDVQEHLEKSGYRVLIPALKGKRNRLTTAESNASRYVTKIRWTVEATHGMLKQKYHLLDQKFDNKMLPRIGSFYRIASFLHNKYNKRLTSDLDYSDEIVEMMKSRNNTNNTLADEVDKYGWQRKKLPFKTISSRDLMDFPEMTEKDLKLLLTGSYQYKQAISYLAEMIDESDNITIQFVRDKTNILKAQVQSRHIGRKVYRCFIEYKPNTIGWSGISRYCCECANGLRTIGCCSHVAAIIFYLAHGRYLSKIPRPAAILNTLFNKDNITTVIDEDSDED